ncbi:hypothetical protein [Halogeometricum sp. CBA1124]|uniref:hypothetical protein n=1 Tax=Halogeometricum sp. CBA1124 TaxID=2668071 RepID=UPI001E2BA075|nr:hypothetical protein [Halogeometricum sp. CBA1124]
MPVRRGDDGVAVGRPRGVRRRLVPLGGDGVGAPSDGLDHVAVVLEHPPFDAVCRV